MQVIYFTIVAIVLYVGSDWILNKIEQARGERFPNRSLVFFIIILVLSLTTFSAINYLASKQANIDTLPGNSEIIQP